MQDYLFLINVCLVFFKYRQLPYSNRCYLCFSPFVPTATVLATRPPREASQGQDSPVAALLFHLGIVPRPILADMDRYPSQTVSFTDT